jgi:hypothetical protein
MYALAFQRALNESLCLFLAAPWLAFVSLSICDLLGQNRSGQEGDKTAWSNPPKTAQRTISFSRVPHNSAADHLYPTTAIRAAFERPDRTGPHCTEMSANRNADDGQASWREARQHLSGEYLLLHLLRLQWLVLAVAGACSGWCLQFGVR